MKKVDCDSCGEEMKLEKNFGVKPRGLTWVVEILH